MSETTAEPCENCDTSGRCTYQCEFPGCDPKTEKIAEIRRRLAEVLRALHDAREEMAALMRKLDALERPNKGA